MAEICGVCDRDISTGTERKKRLKLSGKMAIETRDQIDCFLYQEYGMRIQDTSLNDPSSYICHKCKALVKHSF